MVGGDKGKKKKKKYCKETSLVGIVTNSFTFCFPKQELAQERVEFGAVAAKCRRDYIYNEQVEQKGLM